jgi:hypothetical protein|uniref:Uncharacterized protein n=1 Tax=Myoviridae sp. ctsNY46 TaxID=2825192 RepID=A0A8S5U7E1_9CAUD|nr:MAG TPA: hypothetical protein [Myoviridae sp. ctsNY46]
MNKKIRKSLAITPVSLVAVLWYNKDVKKSTKTAQEEQKWISMRN